MAERETAFRRFELTVSVWYPKHAELPETFRDWVDVAFGTDGMDLPASGTRLERVVETRHPPAEDVVAKRRKSYETRSGGLWG